MKKFSLGFCPIFEHRNTPAIHWLMLQSLKKYFNVKVIGPEVETTTTARTFREYLRELAEEKKNPEDVLAVFNRMARSLEERIARHDVSCLFFPENEIVAFMKLKVPAVLCSHSFMEDRSRATGGDELYTKLMNAVRRKILGMPVYIQLSSFESIKLLYDIKAFTTTYMYDVPCGPVISGVPSREDALAFRKIRDKTVCRLLFAGSDWYNDGGDAAFDIVDELDHNGLNAELIVTSCEVPMRKLHPRIKGPDTRLKEEEKNEDFVRECYQRADFVIMPKVIENAPEVIAAAAAWALPVIGENTGDVHFLVRDGQTGYLTDFESGRTHCADIIKAVAHDDALYQALAVQARDRYDLRFNWDTWGEKTARVIRSITEAPQEYGRQRLPSKKEMSSRPRPFYVLNHAEMELDITWRCNLRCPNCSRSCGVAPSREDMSVAQIEKFLEESKQRGHIWTEIRVIGGEPTLHPQILEIFALLLEYKAEYPQVRVSISTNGHGDIVKNVLRQLPDEVLVHNTNKTSSVQPFLPTNNAPVDSGVKHNYATGCLMTSCGLGLTPYGYYHCSLAGGIDRIFGYNLGRKDLPKIDDLMLKEKSLLCRLCGFFHHEQGEARETQVTSPTWQKALDNYKSARKRMSAY